MSRKRIGYPVHPEKFSVISPFGVTRKLAHYKEPRTHWGIDIPLVIGEDVLAVCDHSIILVRDDGDRGFGKWILTSCRHDDGQYYYFYYAHLDEVLVSEQAMVSKGEVIAKSGNTGGSEGPHLHFQVCRLDPTKPELSLAASQYSQTAVDPMLLFQADEAEEVIVA